MEKKETVVPITEMRALEFQDFLKRVQTLQMSHNESRDLVNGPNICSSMDIEVGEEPPTTSFADNIDKACPLPVLRSSDCDCVPLCMTNIRVSVGIDKDLEMILEMDPSIVDLGDISIDETAEPRIVGLPPLSGG